MRIFSTLYEKMIAWARHRHAPYYLFGLSFAEYSFFPIPPDFMLAPMALANPSRAWNYATLTTIASVLGGIAGYFIGLLAFKLVHPYIINFGYENTYQQIETWFSVWGFWIIFVAGFAPIPYKLFTIAAGALKIALVPFVLGSIVGRGGRFFLVTLAIKLGGEKLEQSIAKYIDHISWVLVGCILLFACWHFWYK